MEQERMMYKAAALGGLAGTAHSPAEKVAMAEELADLAIAGDVKRYAQARLESEARKMARAAADGVVEALESDVPPTLQPPPPVEPAPAS